VGATVVVAIIYLALGVLVGTLVRSDMNGALIVSLAWVFDVFFGPGLGPSALVLTRLFPLHFPTLVLMGQASRHAGPLGDVGWALLWALVLSGVAIARLVATTRPAPTPAGPPHSTVPAPAIPAELSGRALPAPRPSPLPSPAAAAARPLSAPHRARSAAASARIGAVLRAGVREYRRNRVLWVLLVVVPAVFIAMAVAVTPDKLGPVILVDGGRRFTAMLSMRRVHAATMAPVTAAFLAGITGLFVITGSAGGDRRLVLAGLRPREVLVGRLGVIAGAGLLTTTVAVAVSGVLFPPRQWAVFATANLLIALSYALVGVLVGPLAGRLGGLYLILLLAFVDVGLGQTVMFNPVPPAWGAFLPARGASRMLIDGAFTSHVDTVGYLLLSLAWLGALAAAAVVVFQRRNRSEQPQVPAASKAAPKAATGRVPALHSS